LIVSIKALSTRHTARAFTSGSIFVGITTSSPTQIGAASNLGHFTFRSRELISWPSIALARLEPAE
jgi:hypothetical protein